MILFQKGFNFGQDGPGNRLVYHMAGCNLRCPWCANPEGMDGKNVKKFPDKFFTMTKEELVIEAQSSKPMFFAGGGVTFTGGEPTCQFGELKEALAALREAGIHTAIETNATSPHLPELFPLINCLMMDVKHVSGEVFKRVTGGELATVKENLRLAVEYYDCVWVRIPLIHAFNDGDLEGFRAFFARFPREKLKIEILPYHEYGKKKWEESGLTYTVTDGYPSKQKIEEFRQL